MKDALMKFLTSLGLENELGLYLRLFKQSKPHKFAVIKISGATLSENMGAVSDDLAFLSKLGLCPIVIHGGGKPIEEALKKKGIESKKINGLRITDSDSIKIVSKVMDKLTTDLVSSINKKGGRAININDLGMIEVQKAIVDGVDLGFVAEVTNIHSDKIKELCSSGHIPVLASLGKIKKSAYNINADILSNEIVKKIKPKKFILLTGTGGILDKDGKIISAIDIKYDLKGLIENKVINEGMLLKVQEIEKLLTHVPDTIVEICSPENLLKELFTVKGSGTFVRYGGNFIIKKNFSGLNTKKIKSLLEDSFGKILSDNYFDYPIDSIILEKDYSAIAIIKKFSGHYYLDKFAVSKNAQGNGLGKSVWCMIKKYYPSLIWRSTIENSINGWYFKNADGVQKNHQWVVFWYNMQPSITSSLVPAICNMPQTLTAKCDTLYLNQNKNFNMVTKC
ncbi:MAG: acetylglutamate kinase [Candidatus Micrarchaeota archaeon]